MKLLLDEMYPYVVAEQLRRLKHEVDPITERTELRTFADGALFETAQRERRVVLTENIADFSRLADERDGRGRAHHGLILVDPGKYPRGDPATVGRMVTELDSFLRQHPNDEATSLRHWL